MHFPTFRTLLLQQVFHPLKTIVLWKGFLTNDWVLQIIGKSFIPTSKNAQLGHSIDMRFPVYPFKSDSITVNLSESRPSNSQYLGCSWMCLIVMYRLQCHLFRIVTFHLLRTLVTTHFLGASGVEPASPVEAGNPTGLGEALWGTGLSSLGPLAFLPFFLLICTARTTSLNFGSCLFWRALARSVRPLVPAVLGRSVDPGPIRVESWSFDELKLVSDSGTLSTSMLSPSISSKGCSGILGRTATERRVYRSVTAGSLCTVFMFGSFKAKYWEPILIRGWSIISLSSRWISNTSGANFTLLLGFAPFKLFCFGFVAFFRQDFGKLFRVEVAALGNNGSQVEPVSTSFCNFCVPLRGTRHIVPSAHRNTKVWEFILGADFTSWTQFFFSSALSPENIMSIIFKVPNFVSDFLGGSSGFGSEDGFTLIRCFAWEDWCFCKASGSSSWRFPAGAGRPWPDFSGGSLTLICTLTLTGFPPLECMCVRAALTCCKFTGWSLRAPQGVCLSFREGLVVVGWTWWPDVVPNDVATDVANTGVLPPVGITFLAVLKQGDVGCFNGIFVKSEPVALVKGSGEGNDNELASFRPCRSWLKWETKYLPFEAFCWLLPLIAWSPVAACFRRLTDAGVVGFLRRARNSPWTSRCSARCMAITWSYSRRRRWTWAFRACRAAMFRFTKSLQETYKNWYKNDHWTL